MRCGTCTYPLWNLTSRVCPECGSPFRPSDFDFIANSVRFCCPHCGQDYYGTGPRGHLDPVEFDCVKCSKHIHMDEMVLLPTEGVKEEQTEVDRVPWLVRDKIGLRKAWYGTVWRALFEPGRLARATPAASPIGPAWWFSLFTNCIFLVLGAGIGGCLIFSLPFFMAVGGRGGPGIGVLFGLGVALLVAIAIIGAAFPLWGLLTHGLLRLTGPTALGPGASVRTLCYASGANVIAAIPCLGLYLSIPALLWTGISAAVQLRTVQGVGWLRAFIAALTPPVVLIAGIVAVWIWIVTTAVTYSAHMASSGGLQAIQMVSTQKVAGALGTYRAAHADAFPIHALELMQNGGLFASDLEPQDFTRGTQPRPGNSLADAFQAFNAQQEAAAVQAAQAGITPGTIAHRLGDFVFTYHGIDPTTGDPGLWTAIYFPEGSKPAFVSVASLDGTVQTIPAFQWPGRLAAQNRLRAPLPPLPDPAAISESAPAK